MLLVVLLGACGGDEAIPEGGGGTPPSTTPGDEPAPGPDDPFFRPVTEWSKAACNRVFEYTPAPGQFINDGYEAGSPEGAAAYAQGRFFAGLAVSLGGWGGTVVVGFDHSILNGEGADIAVRGNAYEGSSEPGIVWVARDENGNGLPDDTWYELRGSDYGTSIHGYSVTYYRPSAPNRPVAWSDNMGGSGEIDYLGFHNQPYYYPGWISANSYTLTGVLLPSRTTAQGGIGWVNDNYPWGYADNYGSDYIDGNALLDLDNAVCSDGTAAGLEYIDFVKVQTGVNAKAGALGEISTEVLGIGDYHIR